MDLYTTITNAREILKLPESATLDQIKNQYRGQMKIWHPDACTESRETCENMAKRITDAYRILVEYCNTYEYSFKKEEVEKYISEKEWWINRYGSDPVWG